MTPSEIIANDPATQKVGAAKVLTAISRLLKSGQGIILQRRNTVMLFIAIDKHVAEVHIYSVDKPVAMGVAMKYFLQKAQESEISRVYGSAPLNSPIMKLVRMMGIPVVESDRKNYSWMLNV